MPPRDRYPSDPESGFDTWLDALVAGTPAAGASRDDDTGPLARAMAGARQLHGLAARSAMSTRAAQRRIEEELMQRGALAAPGGMIWTPERSDKRRAPWWSPASPVLATAVAFAVIAALVGSLIWTQRPVLTPAPENPGFAVASPDGTPEGALSCGSPGYAPVVSGEVEPNALAMIGETEQPIVLGQESVTVPFGEDGETTLPGVQGPLSGARGVFATYNEEGSWVVTNVVLGRSWEFPMLDIPDDTTFPLVSSSFISAGPYVVGPVDSTGVDYTILDTRTGDAVTTSELLGGTFPWMVVIVWSTLSDNGSSYQAVQFVRASENLTSRLPERLAEDERAVTDRELSDTVAVVLPGGVEGAAVVDVSGTAGEYGNPGVAAVTFSHDRSLVAWRGWNDDRSYGFFISPVSDVGDPIVTVEIDSPSVSNPIIFSPDDSTLYVRADNAISAIAVDSGTVTEVAASQHGTPQIMAANDAAGTVIVSVNPSETWLLDTSSGNMARLAQLDGYTFFSRLEDTSLALGQKSVPGELGSGEGSIGFSAIVDTATGEIVAETSEPTVGSTGSWPYQEVAVSDRFVAELDPTADAFRITDTTEQATWTLELPDSGTGSPDLFAVDASTLLTRPVISPGEACLLLNVYREIDREGDAVQSTSVTEHIGTWVAPLEPDAVWTQLDVELVEWWEVPVGDDGAETLPAPDFTTPVATPEAAAPGIEDGPFVTSIAVTAVEDIYVQVLADGMPAFEGDLAAGESTGHVEGSTFEVYTSSGVSTLFSNACGTPPFNMGYEPGEAFYILQADAESCPPVASPAASPVATPAAGG